jgi:hypothetical protein
MKDKRGKKGPKEKSATEQAMSKALMNQTKGSRAVEKMMEVGRGSKSVSKAPTTEKALPFLSKTSSKSPHGVEKIIESGLGDKPVPKAPVSEKVFPFASKTSSKSQQVVEKMLETGRGAKPAPNKTIVVAAAVPPSAKKTPGNAILIRKPRPGGVFLEQNPWANPKGADAPDVDELSSEERRPTAPRPVVEVALQPSREMRPKEPAGESAPLSLEDIVAAARRDASARAVAPELSRHLAHEHRIVNKEQAGRPMKKTAASHSHGQSAGKRVPVTSLGSGAWNALGSTTRAITGSGESMIQTLRSGVSKICGSRCGGKSARPSQGDNAPSKKEGPVGAAFNTASAAAGKTAEGLASIMSGAKKAVGYVIKGTLEGPVDLLNGVVKGVDTVANQAKRSFRGSSTKPHSARR